jgi:hypothetical protein
MQINVGENRFSDYKVSLNLDKDADIDESVEKVCALLKEKKVIVEYYI